MSDAAPDPRCEDVARSLPELALGVLTGRERATALAHVDVCPRCADELEQLSRAADAMVFVAPEAEPPVGFEVNLFARMGFLDDLSRRRHRLSRPRAWVFATAAAVVALAAGLAIGWSTSTRVPDRPAVGTGHASDAVTVALVEHGHSVGHVSTSGGSRPWMYMTLDGASARGEVTCRVVTADGAVHTIGTFDLKRGYGAWGAPLPVRPTDIRMAEVVSSTGTVLATATLHAAHR